MDIGPAKLAWPWLSEDEVRERLANAIARGRVVVSTEEELKRIEEGDWKRVGTWTECEVCGKFYVDHPTLDSDPWLHRICGGILGKT